MILLYHVGDPAHQRPCLGPAFGVVKRHVGHDMPAENVLKLDGTKPRPGEGMICGTCRRPVHLSWLSYQRPLALRTVE